MLNVKLVVHHVTGRIYEVKLYNIESLHVYTIDVEGRNHFIIKAGICPEALRILTMIPGPPRAGSVPGENIS